MRKPRQHSNNNYNKDTLFSKFKYAKPLTNNQKIAEKAFNNDKNLFLTGYAGTGKTFLALNYAYQSLIDGEIDKIVIFRNPVPTRDVGFLPGKLEQKLEVYEEPYINITKELFNCSVEGYKYFKNSQIVNFKASSFARGITLDNSFVIIDEIQNCNEHEAYSLLTRLGENCRVIISGDFFQCDLTKEKSGFKRLVYCLKKMKSFETIDFGIEDIVRSDFVAELIKAWHTYEDVQPENIYPKRF